jgi:hypothetical protein
MAKRYYYCIRYLIGSVSEFETQVASSLIRFLSHLQPLIPDQTLIRPQYC